MKKSLKQAINVFSYYQKIILLLELVCRKFGFTIGSKGDLILAQCEHYVQLIERGVSIKREIGQLLKFNFILNEKEYIFFVRKASSDIRVFESVILLEEYQIAKEHLLGTGKENIVMIDAGANIGFTTLYLHAFFPTSKFVIIEPDPNNCLMLKKNLSINNITNFTIFQNALWINDDELLIDNTFRDGKEWSLSVAAEQNSTTNKERKKVKGITLNSIAEIINGNSIFLFKIDVEGSERFLFQCNSFLNSLSKYVDNMVIEIHDEYDIRHNINNKMSELGFELNEFRDITFFARN